MIVKAFEVKLGQVYIVTNGDHWWAVEATHTMVGEGDIATMKYTKYDPAEDAPQPGVDQHDEENQHLFYEISTSGG